MPEDPPDTPPPPPPAPAPPVVKTKVSSFRRLADPLILLAIIIVTGLICWKGTYSEPGPVTVIWVVNMLLLLAFTVIAGHAITGLFRGALIDSRNKISLSRFQLLLWTILLLAGFLTAVLINVRGHQKPALAIALHPDLWALMGISATSLVGSPLIKNNKKSQPTNTEATAKTKALLDSQGAAPSGGVEAEGQLLTNESPADASWTDIFKGEEVGNAANLDLGKIQMFYFTLIVWASYAITLASMLQKATKTGFIDAFPDLDAGMLALLGISHAAYLTNKAVPHTPPGP